MAIQSELLDYLAHLKAVDSPAERKALVLSTGQSDLGIYLEWQGSAFAFFTNLLEVLSRRGQARLVGFLAGLAHAPQVGVDLKDKLAGLRAQVEALDTAGFAAEFPALAAAPPVAGPADPDMLAVAVSEVLAPYYALGADGLRKKAGERAATLAGQVAQAVEGALAGDATAMAILSMLKTAPAAGQPAVLTILKPRLAQDTALAGQLAGLLATAEAEPESGGFQSLLNVNQEIGVVRGDVVGAVIGADVLEGIRAKIDVKQQVDRVEGGGALVGAVMGGNAPINIGGTHYQGDNINTGGGAFVGGNLQVGRDFTGRDQVIHGDQVDGDQITVGDISDGAGIAVGRDAQAHVQQGLSGAEVDRLFAPLLAAVAGAPPDKRVQALQAATELKGEVAKGKAADDGRMAKLIDGLVALVPGAVGAVTSMFATPILGGLAGNVTQFVLDRIRGS